MYDYLLNHLFFNTLDRNPDKTAVIDGNRHYTFGELSLRAGSIADVLKSSGIKKGDRVSFFFEHGCDQVVSILAISSLGAVFVPVNAMLFPEQIYHIINDSGTKVLLTSQTKSSALTELKTRCADLDKIIFFDNLSGAMSLEQTNSGIENDLAALLYTSGSSGLAKGVMISHRNLVAGTKIVTQYLGLGTDDRLIGVLPLSFDYGLNQFTTMMYTGGTYVFCNFRFPNDIVRTLDEHKITGCAGVPPIWALLARSSLSTTALPALRYITNSGGTVPATILEKLRNNLPDVKIILMYGLTEAFRSTYLPWEFFNSKKGSMGKAIPNTEIFVVKENGDLCGPDEEGELVHRGPTVSMGYWNRKADNEIRFRKNPLKKGEDDSFPEYVVFSGDIVKTDADGFLFFVGRKDGMIKSCSIRVSPTEIEDILFKSGMVKEAAAIGIPDVNEGNVIKVFVVVTEEFSRMSDDEFVQKVSDYCSKTMPHYMVPKTVEIRTVLPKTPTGKIDYQQLKKDSAGD